MKTLIWDRLVGEIHTQHDKKNIMHCDCLFQPKDPTVMRKTTTGILISTLGIELFNEENSLHN